MLLSLPNRPYRRAPGFCLHNLCDLTNRSTQAYYLAELVRTSNQEDSPSPTSLHLLAQVLDLTFLTSRFSRQHRVLCPALYLQFSQISGTGGHIIFVSGHNNYRVQTCHRHVNNVSGSHNSLQIKPGRTQRTHKAQNAKKIMSGHNNSANPGNFPSAGRDFENLNFVATPTARPPFFEIRRN
jgi:hypothetical protein